MAVTRILLNTFEPALTDGNWKTSMAGGFWWLKLFEELHTCGISVNNVSVGEIDFRDDVYNDAMQNITVYDGIMLYLRWPMPDVPRYAMRNAAYFRQLELIEAAKKYQIPVLIFNGDMADSGYDLANEVRNAARCDLYMPSLQPWVDYKTLHFLNPHGPREFLNKELKFRSTKFCYVGNSLNLYDRAKRIIGDSSGKIYGPWTEVHDAAKLAADFPNIEFCGRIDQRDLFTTLGDAYYTVHLTKPQYATTGFIAQRWYEAAVAGTVAMVDPQYLTFDELKAYDVKYVPETEYEYQCILSDQRATMMRLSNNAYEWVKAIKNLTGGWY